jgi:predicted lipid-binding transport protein (Tim44 family)
MKRFLLFLTLALAGFSMLSVTAEAKRMGGGGNIGQQRTMSQQQVSKTPAAAPTPAATGNKWLGPLAGLAIGAGLGALFAGGMGGAMGGILMALLAAGVVMFLVSRFRKSQGQQPAMQYAGGASAYQPEAVQQPFSGGSAATGAPLTNSSSNIPADFPVEAFLRSAKTSFIRLQAANDRKDLDDIREYTTPEMFAEISMQLQERGNAPQKTDVLAINTQIVEVVNEGDYAIASVRMSGQLSENNGTPESFDEIWHVQKNLRDEKAVWLLSGIQQVA